MIDFREVLTAHLKTIHPRIYFQKAPAKRVYPYLVYEVDVLPDGQGFQLISVEIDGWDNQDDTTELETLMENLNHKLDKKTLTDDNLTVSFYLERKLPIPDDDPRINRRKYTYQARLFERS